MIILTAYDSKFKEIGDLCVESIKRYCKRYRHISWSALHIPDDYDRPQSWFKIQAILRALPFTDHVLWIDADALLVGDVNYANIVSFLPETLHIAKDANGINHGVVSWKHCQQAFCALSRMDGMTEFYNHQWWEQAALTTFIDELDVRYHDKVVWNAYPEDYDPKRSQVLHFPGMSVEERLAAMKKHLCLP